MNNLLFSDAQILASLKRFRDELYLMGEFDFKALVYAGLLRLDEDAVGQFIINTTGVGEKE